MATVAPMLDFPSIPRVKVFKSRFVKLSKLRGFFERKRRHDAEFSHPVTGRDIEGVKTQILLKKFKTEDSGFVPVPGRASNATNLEEYDRYLEKIKSFERDRHDFPYNEELWGLIRMFLEAANPPAIPSKENPRVPVTPAQNVKYLEELLPKPMVDKWADNLPPHIANAFRPYITETPSLPICVISPIHPILMSLASGIPVHHIVNELCYATKVGLAKMMFSPACGRCCAEAGIMGSIAKFPAEHPCCACQHVNAIDNLDLVKVVFSLHPDVLYMMLENSSCVPSKKAINNTELLVTIPPSVLDVEEMESDDEFDQDQGFQCFVGCGKEDVCFREPLPAGRYRLHCSLTKTDGWLEVERDATKEDDPAFAEIRVSELFVLPGSENYKTIHVEHGKIIFDIITDTLSWFGLWILQDKDNDALLHLPKDEQLPFTSVSELMSNAVFQRLFADEIEKNLDEEILKLEKHKRLVQSQS